MMLKRGRTLLGLFLLAVGVLGEQVLQPQEPLSLDTLDLQNTCASLTSCASCANVTLCHWCPDQHCHAVGSIHGCTIGTYCYDNDQCLRKEPEYRGFALPSFAVMLGACLLGGISLTCAMAAISFARELSVYSLSRDALLQEADYHVLAGDSSDSGDEEGPRAVVSGVAKPDAPPSAPPSRNACRRCRRRRWARANRAHRGSAASVAGKLYLLTKLVCGTGLAVILLGSLAALYWWPHYPVVNVCNTQFDWGSIVHSLKKVSVEVDYQILVSIYNPNNMDVSIESGSATLSHQHTEVGTMQFEPVVAKGGYITDMLLTIAINGKTWDDLKLGLEYKTGELSFLMDATVYSSLSWHGWKTYPLPFTISNYFIKVSDVTAYDRSICNCPEMMQLLPPF